MEARQRGKGIGYGRDTTRHKYGVRSIGATKQLHGTCIGYRWEWPRHGYGAYDEMQQGFD